MKFNTSVSSSRRTQRRAHFSATSGERRLRMASTLSTELRAKHGVLSRSYTLPSHLCSLLSLFLSVLFLVLAPTR